eukprot:s1037_g8.t1
MSLAGVEGLKSKKLMGALRALWGSSGVDGFDNRVTELKSYLKASPSPNRQAANESSGDERPADEGVRPAEAEQGVGIGCAQFSGFTDCGDFGGWSHLDGLAMSTMCTVYNKIEKEEKAELEKELSEADIQAMVQDVIGDLEGQLGTSIDDTDAGDAYKAHCLKGFKLYGHQVYGHLFCLENFMSWVERREEKKAEGIRRILVS